MSQYQKISKSPKNLKSLNFFSFSSRKRKRKKQVMPFKDISLQPAHPVSDSRGGYPKRYRGGQTDGQTKILVSNIGQLMKLELVLIYDHIQVFTLIWWPPHCANYSHMIFSFKYVRPFISLVFFFKQKQKIRQKYCNSCVQAK